MDGTDRISTAKLRLLDAQLEMVQAELAEMSRPTVTVSLGAPVRILDRSPEGMKALGKLILGVLNSDRPGNPPPSPSGAR